MRPAVIVVVLLAVLAVTSAFAEPYVSVWGEEAAATQATSSWYGNTGLIITPTTATPPASAASVAAHWVDRDPDATALVSVNFGLTNELEVGGAWIETPADDSEVIVNLKYRLDIARWLEEPNLPDLALGVFDIANQLDRSWYLVLGKSFRLDENAPESPQIGLHVGYADSDTGGGPLDGLFAGVDFKAFRYGVIQAEYDGDDINAAIRYNATDQLSLDLGILDGDLGAGATYRSRF